MHKLTPYAIGHKYSDTDFCKKLWGYESKVRIDFKYSTPYLNHIYAFSNHFFKKIHTARAFYKNPSQKICDQ